MDNHDIIHRQEQAHLNEIYAKLLEIHDNTLEDIEVTQNIARQDLIDMSEEIRPDFGGADEAMETLAAIETLNTVIDAYNQRHDFALERLKRTILLLLQPYFAKVSLIMREGEDPRDIYIGAAGITDENHVPLIVDWRSPVAETYYNQESGATSFSVDGRVRTVELVGRRQFDITRNHLNMYFDTSVAIEDSLLLQALRSHRSEKLQAITATIQREQNEVVRHEDIDCLVVNGIAGSGKTSVMLQRIAYLFYYQRETLSPDQLVLFTPNDIFGHYIDTVLPSLGEANPPLFTWSEFIQSAGLNDRNDGRLTNPERLKRIEAAIPQLKLERDDFFEISYEGVTLLTTSQIRQAYDKYPRIPAGPRRIAATIEELHARLERKLERMAKDADIQEEMFALDIEDQLRILGEPLGSLTDDQTIEFARTYVQARFGQAHQLIEDARWVRIDRIGQTILGPDTLNACEWLYLHASLTGRGAPHIKYVMVDEVQDYTAAQIMVLSRYFSRAHFLLLGDENQAIYPDTASFSDIISIFEALKKKTEVCELLTSYRSTPEITALFCKLIDSGAEVKMAAVQREGAEPRMMSCATQKDYLSTLKDLITEEEKKEGLCAIIVDTPERAHWLTKELSDQVQRIEKASTLPKSGVVLLELNLAKGLEFDRVIVADAQLDTYDESPLATRRLYTALSRATGELTLLSQGEMSSLLG